MLTPIVVGNWKMNNTIEQARSLVYPMSLKLREIKGVEIVLCPPFPAIMAVSALLQATDIKLGAQNIHWQEKGAFTGEVAPNMISEYCSYVIIGHSERRANFGETDESVNLKVRAAMEHELTPILCVGETKEEYDSDRTSEVVRRQLNEGLKDISSSKAKDNLVIAYEPIWAIGTGLASSPENANAVLVNHIRPTLENLFGAETAQSIRIQYGGSVNGANASEFFSQPEIEGALVGGASLKEDDFVAIVQAAAK
ncbi:MAG: triose-phosphate isomerase [Anaerolineae bacterium]|nr:triose-phosphate isomerase [Anaerolineae bacterium]